MTDRPLPTDETIENVVRSFTQSELALADAAAAIAKFRTASEQLAAAEAGAAAATDALRAASEASDRVGEQLQAVVAGLGATVAALRAIDPTRLWAHLEQTKSQHEGVEAQRAIDQSRLEERSRLLLRIVAIGAAAAVGTLILAALVAIGVLPA